MTKEQLRHILANIEKSEAGKDSIITIYLKDGSSYSSELNGVYFNPVIGILEIDDESEREESAPGEEYAIIWNYIKSEDVDRVKLMRFETK